MDTLPLANLTIVRKMVRLPEEGTPQTVTFDSLEIDPQKVAGSIFSIHRTSPNTYDVVLVVSTFPDGVVEAAEQARNNQKAAAFESLFLEAEDDDSA